IPADPFKLPLTLGPGAFHRPLQAFGVINAIQIARDFLAEESTRERVVGVAPQVDRLAVPDCNDQPAGVGAVVRTDGTKCLGLTIAHGKDLRHGELDGLILPGVQIPVEGSPYCIQHEACSLLSNRLRHLDTSSLPRDSK